MGNDVSVSASDFTSTNLQTFKFGSYIVNFSIFHVTETNQKFVKSSHLNTSLTCFMFKSEEEAVAKECFNNALAIKSLRHPSIVKFLDSMQQSWLTGIITELVSPLEDYIPDLYPDEAMQGFHSICSALAFLHTKAQLSHNNVSLRSIFCTSQGQWKLGGFELCRPFSQMSPEALKAVRTRLGDCGIGDNEAYAFSADRRDSFDLYCLGCTAVAVCDSIDASELSDNPTDKQQRRQLDQLRNLAKNCLRCASPSDRTPAQRLQRHAAFSSHGFTRLAAFLADFSLKSEDELRQFYVGLKSRLFELPEGLVARRLGRLLLGRLPLTHPMASTYLLPYLLRPYRGAVRPPDGDSLLSEADFRRELVPYLAMVLRIRDLPVRCALLDHFPAYCHLMDWRENGAHRSLIPELLVGLRDRHDRLVALTHLAVAALLPLAGFAALFGDKADAARQSLFTDAQPRRRLLGAAPGDPGQLESSDSPDRAGGFDNSNNSSLGGSSAPAGTRLRDLAALSDRYRGPEEAAAAEAQRQAALVEAESARILADRQRGKSATASLATVATASSDHQAATFGASSESESEVDDGWGNDWDGAGAGAAAEDASDVNEDQAASQPPATSTSVQKPAQTLPSSSSGGLTAEALTIRPVVTSAGRQIDEFLAELEPSIRAGASSTVAMETNKQQHADPNIAVSASVTMETKASTPSGLALTIQADEADGWSDDGDDAWGLQDEAEDAAEPDTAADASSRCNGEAGADNMEKQPHQVDSLSTLSP